MPTQARSGKGKPEPFIDTCVVRELGKDGFFKKLYPNAKTDYVDGGTFRLKFTNIEKLYEALVGGEPSLAVTRLRQQHGPFFKRKKIRIQDDSHWLARC